MVVALLVHDRLSPRMADRPRPFRFYAADMSYFSGKVRPALRAKRVPFDEILPTTAAYRQVIVPRTGLSMIPTVVTPEDDTWQDTSDILDALEARFPEPPLFPETPVQRLTAFLMELYADEFLMLPGLHYRWSTAEGETRARQEFAIMTGDAPRANRFADGVRMFTQLVGVRPETIPAIETHTHDLLAALEAHLTGHTFLLGERPSLADCALMGPLYAHLYLDVVPGRLLRETAPRTCHWIERMNHPDPDSFGAWLPGDTLAPTLRPILDLIGRDAVPLVLDTVRAFEDWADGREPPADELPRGVGMHRTALRGVAFERFTLSYTLWMVQRVLAAHHALDGAGRAAVAAALAGTGCEEVLAYAPRHRVVRRPYKLFLQH
jgi:glutathione S-transferase